MSVGIDPSPEDLDGTRNPARTGPTVLSSTGFGYFPVAFMARFPFAMMIVGTLTLVVTARDSISLAGINSAAVGLGGAIGGPILGAAADRLGQRRVLLTAGTVNGIALLALAAVAYSSLPDAALLAVGVLTGASCPQVGPMSRSRLVTIIARALPAERRRPTADRTMAYESAADEVTFVFGPVLVGVLATVWGAAAAMIGAAALTFVFVTAFALHRSGRAAGEHGAAAVVPDPARQLFTARIFVLVAGALAMGFVFGAVLTSLTAFMADRGRGDAAGLVYGALGVGSAIMALSSAALPVRFTQAARWITCGAILFTGGILLGLADTLGGVVVAISLTGFGAGPSVVTFFSLAADRAPRGRSATVMTMLGAAITVGQAIASAVTGDIAAGAGTRAALWLPALAGALVVVTGLANRIAFGARRGGAISGAPASPAPAR